MTTLLNIKKYHAHNLFSGKSKSFYSFEDCFQFIQTENESQEDFGDTNYEPSWSMYAEIILDEKINLKNGAKIS